MDLLKRIKDGELPKDVLNALSTMSFPLTPEDYVQILPYVFEQGDKVIKGNVSKNLRDIPDELLLSQLDNTNDPQVLVFYFQFFLKVELNPEFVIRILNNPYCPPSLFKIAAQSSMPEVLTFLVNNVSILQKFKEIVPLLRSNKHLDGFLKEKLKEYEEFGILGEERKEPEEKVKEKAKEKEQEVVSEEVESLKNELLEKAEKEGIDVDKTSELQVSEEELEEEEDLTLYQKILRMTVAQKIDRALKGTKEERTLLIRDSNKVVAMAVIQSPKITEQEVAAIAGMRNVHKDVLRYIGTNRQFLKKYKIILALVKNPKTPPDIALTLLNRIGERDLKALVRDRGISEFVRQAAKRILVSRKK